MVEEGGRCLIEFIFYFYGLKLLFLLRWRHIKVLKNVLLWYFDRRTFLSVSFTLVAMVVLGSWKSSFFDLPLLDHLDGQDIPEELIKKLRRRPWQR